MLTRSDLKRPEDVDSSGADHGLDAMRYGVHRMGWATELQFEFPNDHTGAASSSGVI